MIFTPLRDEASFSEGRICKLVVATELSKLAASFTTSSQFTAPFLSTLLMKTVSFSKRLYLFRLPFCPIIGIDEKVNKESRAKTQILTK